MHTKYILSADFDHLFSRNFERKMLHLAGTVLTRRPRTALVYRIFEVDERAVVDG